MTMRIYTRLRQKQKLKCTNLLRNAPMIIFCRTCFSPEIEALQHPSIQKLVWDYQRKVHAILALRLVSDLCIWFCLCGIVYTLHAYSVFS